MVSKDREYRSFEMRAAGEEYRVEGYAAVFDKETVLYEYDGIEYKEVLETGAFDDCLMSDVVMNYNHEGKPVARTRNNTLTLSVDDVGLKASAYLGGTEEGRKLYDEIKGGYIDKMSFAFVVNQDAYDKDSHTRKIQKIKRLYDVAAVDFPAYDTTSISARSFFEAEVEREQAEARAEARMQAEKLKTKIKIMEALR